MWPGIEPPGVRHVLSRWADGIVGVVESLSTTSHYDRGFHAAAMYVQDCTPRTRGLAIPHMGAFVGGTFGGGG